MATNTNIKVTADTSQAERALGDLNNALKGLEKSTANTAKVFAVLTAAAAGIGYAIKTTLDSAGQLFDAANALGVSVPALQAFQKAAAGVGVDADALNASLMRMNANIGDALIKGTGPAVSAFERMGISLQSINGMKPEQQFELIAKKLSEIPNQAERSALAMDLFGKQGPKILKIAQELDGVKKKMEEMGLIISPEQQAALDIAGDKLEALGGTINTALKKAVASLAPYIIAFVDAIDKAIKNAGGLDAILAKIGATIRFAMNVALIMSMVKAIQLMVIGIKNAQSAFIIFNTIVKRSPLFLLVGAAAALATYFGVDVVGALDSVLGVSESVADANRQIADEAANITEENNRAAEAVRGLNEEQKKVLAALDETIAKKQGDIQYQQDLINFTEQEATIRKALNDEDIKAKKAKIPLDNAEYVAKRNVYEANLRSEASLKRQITLQKEQANAVVELLAPIGNVGKELQKFADLDFKLRLGLTDEEIKKTKEAILFTEKGREDALNNQKEKVKDAVNLELGKFSAYIQAQDNYNKATLELDAIKNFEEQKVLTLNEEQKLALKKGYLVAEMQLQEDRVKIAEEINNKIFNLELSRIQRTIEANKSLVAQKLTSEDQAILQAQGAAERQKAISAERVAFEKKSELEKTQFAIDQGAQMFSALGAHNKKAFEAAKAFNIANAIMNTYMAATKALATYPPPFSFIAAGAAIGMGLAQVATIRQQQYSGRALGGPVMGGTPYIVGENGPELFTPNQTGSIMRNSELTAGGGSPTVNFNIQAVDASSFDQLLVSRRGMITQIISDAMAEKGQRSRM